MALSEQQYIMLCKKQIEEKYSLCNSDGYMHRDLEILSRLIEEKTGVSISHSTLKRLWKNKFKQSPQSATLNALAAMLDFKDWQEVSIRVKGGKAEIGINGKVAFNEVFKEDFGKVKGLIYLFDGTGSIDYVKLSGADGQIVFEDNFEKQ